MRPRLPNTALWWLTVGILLFLAALLVAPDTAYPHTAQPDDFNQRATAAGWDPHQLGTLVCVITKESNWDQDAHNPNDPGYGSYGWTQINMSTGPSGTWAYYRQMIGTRAALFQPDTNLKVAHDLHVRATRIWGDGWKPWRPLGECVMTIPYHREVPRWVL